MEEENYENLIDLDEEGREKIALQDEGKKVYETKETIVNEV